MRLSVHLSDADLALVDSARGSLTRYAFVKGAVLSACRSSVARDVMEHGDVSVPAGLLSRVHDHLAQFCDSLDGPMGPAPSEVLATRMLADLRSELTRAGVWY